MTNGNCGPRCRRIQNVASWLRRASSITRAALATGTSLFPQQGRAGCNRVVPLCGIRRVEHACHQHARKQGTTRSEREPSGNRPSPGLALLVRSGLVVLAAIIARNETGGGAHATLSRCVASDPFRRIWRQRQRPAVGGGAGAVVVWDCACPTRGRRADASSTCVSIPSRSESSIARLAASH